MTRTEHARVLATRASWLVPLALFLGAIASPVAAQVPGEARSAAACAQPDGTPAPPLPRVVPMTGLHLNSAVWLAAEYGAQVKLHRKLVVFGQGMGGLAGHGGAVGLYWGERTCDQVPFLGPAGPWGTSVRFSFLRTRGNVMGSEVRPHESYIGGEFRAHVLLVFSVGVYRSLHRESDVPQLVTGAAGIGF